MSGAASLQRSAVTAPPATHTVQTGPTGQGKHLVGGVKSLLTPERRIYHGQTRPGGHGYCSNGNNTFEPPPGVGEVLRSSGQPLDPRSSAFFGNRLGHDFSRVRVHTDTSAAASARSLGAHAYTVGTHIAFASGRYSPGTLGGQHLLAHELAHVAQQGETPSSLQALSIAASNHPSELEAERAADAVMMGGRPRVTTRTSRFLLHRHRDDLVAYSGGQRGHLFVVAAGRVIYMASAVSGHPGRGENEPSAGPIPTGRYTIHPRVTRRTVSSLESGVCGANSIPSGYQELTSTDLSPCSGAHYCNVPCPTPAEPSRHCFTPRDCWGPHRIKIEGGQAVVTPSGRRRIRSGFYIHGGNPADAVSSGCVKSLDDGVFAKIRTLDGVRGAVPFCVGTKCQPALEQAKRAAAVEAVEAATEAAGSFFRGLF